MSAGFDRWALQRELSLGRITHEVGDVFRFTAAPRTALTALWAAYLAVPDSIVSFASSARMRFLDGVPPGPADVSVAHGRRHDVPGVTVHQTRDPWPIEHEIVHGLRVTTVRRTLIDAAGAGWHPARYRHVFLDALDRDLTSIHEVSELAADVLRRGKPGIRLIGVVLDEVRGTPPSRSDLERSLHRVVAEAGLPPLRGQAPLPGRGAVEGTVDGVWDDALTIVETDGRTWHQRRRDMKLDRERDGQAAEAGYLTLRLMHEHVVGDPAGTMRRLQTVRGVRMTQLRPAS